MNPLHSVTHTTGLSSVTMPGAFYTTTTIPDITNSGVGVAVASFPPGFNPSLAALLTGQPAPPATSAPKKRTSFTACAACQSKHCACDEQRPCSRCVRLRIACTEGIPRKGKANKKAQTQKEAPQATTPKITKWPDHYADLERELLAGKAPSQFWSANSTTSSSSSSESVPSTPIPFTPSESTIYGSVVGTPEAVLGSQFFESLINSATDFTMEHGDPQTMLNFSPEAFLSVSSSSIPSPSPSLSHSIDSSPDGQFTSFHNHTPPVPMPFEQAVRSEHSNRSFAMAHITSDSISPSSPSPQSTPSPSQSTLSSSQSTPSPPTYPSTPAAPLSPKSSPQQMYPNYTPPQPHYSQNTTTSTQQYSPHFPLPSAPTSNTVAISNPGESAALAKLQQELAETRRELAAARFRERLSFPLQKRVKPRETGMTLWSLQDGSLVDYSSGFLNLLNHTTKSVENLTFYDISPPATRSQRKHLHAFFLRERPEINSVVTFKSLLNATGKLVDVMCSATVFYFEDTAMIQLVFFSQQ